MEKLGADKIHEILAMMQEEFFIYFTYLKA
jgi:hypothetical protein